MSSPINHQKMTWLYVVLFLSPLSTFAQSPANDNCANAIELTIGISCTPQNYSNENASAEGTAIAPNPSCPHYHGSDVWFKAVMPVSGALRIEAQTLNSATPPSVAVYSGTCGSFNEVTCYVVDRNKTVIDPSLGGQTIYIRIYTYNSSVGKPFSICVYEPTVPPNNNCANAIALTAGSGCSKATYSNAFTNQESTLVAPIPGCNHYAGGDVWFKVPMPSSGALRIETDNLSGTISSSVAIYKGTCGNFTEVMCYELDNGRTLYRNDLVGETLYLRIFSFNTDEGNPFSLCVYEPVIPSNDNCSKAIAIPIGTSCSQANYSNAFATPESKVVAPDPRCQNPGTGDVWFKVVMPASGALRIEAKNQSNATPPSVSIYSGTCGNFTEIICYQQDPAKTIINKNLAGQQLYIRVFTFNTDEGLPFSLCIYEPSVPVNDNCEYAIDLTVGKTCAPKNYSNAFAAGENQAVAKRPSCGYYAGGDVWFTATMPPKGILSFELINLTSSIAPSLTVYSGHCGNFDEVACFSQNENPVIDVPTLAGQKVYLRVFTYNSEEGNSFSICAYEVSCDLVVDNISRTTCEGASMEFGSLTLTQEGLYSQTFKTSDGCDSLVNLTLRFNKVYQIRDTITVCKHENFTFPDGKTVNNIETAFVHQSNLFTRNQCDSVINTYVQIFDVDTLVNSTGFTLTSHASAATYQWLDCSDGFAEINGESNASFNPFRSGNYAVRVSQNGCSAISSCHQILILDAYDNETASLKIYPNPGADNIYVDLPAHGSVTIELLDMQGRTLMFQNGSTRETDESVPINTSQLSSGIYLVRITTDHKTWITRQMILR